MTRRSDIAVIGAGNGGRAFAAYLASRGHDVVLYNRTISHVKRIAESSRIVAEGEVEGTFPLGGVTGDIGTALKDSFLILIVLPASAHAQIAAQIAPHLQDGQIILLNPGRTWGAIHVRNIIRKARPDLQVYVGETETLLFTCREIEDVGVKIFKVKDDNPFCFYPENDNRHIACIIKEIFPNMSVAEDIKITSLMNIGAIIHPTAVVLNAGPIARQQKFLFYREGLTPEVVNIIEKVDKERCAIMSTLDMHPETFLEWAKKSYGVEFTNYYDAFQNIQPYRDIGSPTTLLSRYITEDVPTGLVPFASMGRYFGIQTPYMDSIILMASSLVGIDFMASGRTIENIDLPLDVLENGRQETLVNELFPGQIVNINKIVSRVQSDLYDGWMLVEGRPDYLDLVKKGIFVSSGKPPTRDALHEYVYFVEKGAHPMEIMTVKKSAEIQAVLGLKEMDAGLYAMTLVETKDDFRAQPILSHDDVKSDISAHLKGLKARLQAVGQVRSCQ